VSERLDRRDKAVADLLSLDEEDPREQDPLFLQHPIEPETNRVIGKEKIAGMEPLLVEILREGRLVYDLPGIDRMRQVREADLVRLDQGVRCLVNPHRYHISLTKKLWDLKQSLIRSFNVGSVARY